MRSIIFGLLVLALSVSNAFASCSSDDATCTSMCVISSALTKQFSGGNECLNNCLNAANACEAREAQQRQMEEQRQQMQQQQQAQQQQQRQQAAERQAQQERDAKEIGGKQQRVQQTNEVAQRVGAEAAIQQQFDAAMEKGMQAIDQKGYVSAEYQFKAALKIKPKDVDAKAGLLRAIIGSGRRPAAVTYANEQLLALAAQPPGSNGQSAYGQWLAVLSDNGLATDSERSQLERIYPFGSGDPESAAAAFLRSNPKSLFIPFVRQIASVIPAMRADYADRRKAALEAKASELIEREKVEDEHWKQAQKNATHAAMQSYLTRYPIGRYVAQARKKDEEYQRPPARPNLPFAVDDSIWRTLEASDMYRNAPRPRAMRTRHVQEYVQEIDQYNYKAVNSFTAETTITPVGEKCSEYTSTYDSSIKTSRDRNVTNSSSTSSFYTCGSVMVSSSLRKLGLSGSVYPPSIGAELRMQQESVNLIDRTFDSRSTTHCRITGHMEAKQIHSRLTGTAWVLRCNSESVYIGGATNPLPSQEYEDYLIEDLGIFVGNIGVLDESQHRMVIPGPNFQSKKDADGVRSVTTTLSYEWAVGEAGAPSAPPLAR